MGGLALLSPAVLLFVGCAMRSVVWPWTFADRPLFGVVELGPSLLNASKLISLTIVYPRAGAGQS